MIKIEIEFYDPNEKPPPFDREILICQGSWESHGGPFAPMINIRQVIIRCADVDGDEREGENMLSNIFHPLKEVAFKEPKQLD